MLFVRVRGLVDSHERGMSSRGHDLFAGRN